ncbi:hypothetical protein BGZ63DRAFT_372126 [Mariannaea sp. PMI_226]|nr:hypothetical protein BGZ63DRAFT_372126 [Mariannaea sp. PMI_226]
MFTSTAFAMMPLPSNKEWSISIYKRSYELDLATQHCTSGGFPSSSCMSNTGEKERDKRQISHSCDRCTTVIASALEVRMEQHHILQCLLHLPTCPVDAKTTPSLCSSIVHQPPLTIRSL